MTDPNPTLSLQVAAAGPASPTVMSMDLDGSFLKPSPMRPHREAHSAGPAGKSPAGLGRGQRETAHVRQALSPVAWADDEDNFALPHASLSLGASSAPDRSLLFAPAGDKENAHPVGGGRVRASTGRVKRDDGSTKALAAKKVQSARVRDGGNRSPQGKGKGSEGKAHPASASATVAALRLAHARWDDTADDESLALAEGKLLQLERLAEGHTRARSYRDQPAPGVALGASMSDIEASFMLRQVPSAPVLPGHRPHAVSTPSRRADPHLDVPSGTRPLHALSPSIRGVKAFTLHRRALVWPFSPPLPLGLSLTHTPLPLASPSPNAACLQAKSGDVASLLEATAHAAPQPGAAQAPPIADSENTTSKVGGHVARLDGAFFFFFKSRPANPHFHASPPHGVYLAGRVWPRQRSVA